MSVFLYLSLIVVFIFGCMFFIVQILKISNRETSNSIINFDSYMAIFLFHMQKAYNIVYKEEVLIYSLDGMKLTELEFQKISKEFAVLTLKMIGPNIKKALITLYGDEETLLFNIFEFFNSKFENDEVYNQSIKNLMSRDDLPLQEII